MEKCLVTQAAWLAVHALINHYQYKLTHFNVNKLKCQLTPSHTYIHMYISHLADKKVSQVRLADAQA